MCTKVTSQFPRLQIPSGRKKPCQFSCSPFTLHMEPLALSHLPCESKSSANDVLGLASWFDWTSSVQVRLTLALENPWALARMEFPWCRCQSLDTPRKYILANNLNFVDKDEDIPGCMVNCGDLIAFSASYTYLQAPEPILRQVALKPSCNKWPKAQTHGSLLLEPSTCLATLLLIQNMRETR